jgi:hypothetical protein
MLLMDVSKAPVARKGAVFHLVSFEADEGKIEVSWVVVRYRRYFGMNLLRVW